MTRYTLSFLDDRGRILRTEMLDCATDAEAINALNDEAGGLRVQLWLDDLQILERPGQARPRRLQGCRARRRAPVLAIARH